MVKEEIVDRKTAIIEYELGQFIGVIRRCPVSIKQLVSPFCYELYQENPNDPRVEEMAIELNLLEDPPELQELSERTFRNLATLTETRHLTKMLEHIIEKVKGRKIGGSARRAAVIKKRETVEKLEMLHPDYDLHYKLSKQ